MTKNTHRQMTQLINWAVFIFILATISCSDKKDPNSNPTIISIPANREWTITNLYLSSGQTFNVSVSSTWRNGTLTRSPITTDRRGIFGWQLPGHPLICLVARIGDEKFYVGNGGTFTAPATGTLCLGPNDGPTPDCWADNDGSLTCVIE